MTDSLARLEPLRKKVGRAEVLRETWEAIARKRNAQKQFRTELHTNATSAPAPAMHADITATNADSMLGTDGQSPHTPIKQQNTRDNIENVAAVYQYACPFCAVPVASRVYTGQVDHRHACGNKFRVHAGAISGRVHKHACPTCGTIVSSSHATGRIKVKHKTPSGKTCRQERWQT